MAIKTFQILKYKVYLLRDYSSHPGHTAIVSCEGENGQALAVFFYTPGATPGNNSTDFVNRTFGTSFRPSAEYVWYVDLLRNEHPVYATLDDQNPDENRISCNEPVGEGETFFRPPE